MTRPRVVSLHLWLSAPVRPYLARESANTTVLWCGWLGVGVEWTGRVPAWVPEWIPEALR